MRVDRRSWIRATATATATAPAMWMVSSPQAASRPHAVIHDTRVISYEKHLYHGWPTLTRRKNGQLLLVWSGGRQAHVCPFGRVEWMTSNDQGKTWSWPRTLLDSDIDDRDAGVLETAQGSLLVTTFSSLAYEVVSRQQGSRWSAAERARWEAVQRRRDQKQRQLELGQWMIRSTDGGATWSPRYSSIVNSPHGPFVTSRGQLFYPGVELWNKARRVGVCTSTDDGVSWRYLADIPIRPGDSRGDYHELHGVEATNGSLIVHIRNHNKANAGETLQSESTNGGQSWSIPHSIGVWGLPSHLLRLSDGRLLMSYGYRRSPFGNQARVSTDHGQTWSDPITLSGDGMGGDLGYPSTVEIEGGQLLTVWYEVVKGSTFAVLRQARWALH